MLCHFTRQRRTHNRHHRNRLLRHCALLDSASTDIIQQQHAHLIAGNQLIGTIRALHRNAYAIRIRIRCQHQISSRFFRKLQALLQCLADLRIRIRAGCEIAIRVFLLRNNGDIRDADISQHMRYRDQTGSVQRRIYQLEAGGPAETRANLTGLNCLIERLNAVILNEPDQPLLDAFPERHILRPGQHIRLLNLCINNASRIISHLAAIRSISLIAIILSRIMGSCDHDAGIAVIISRCKA